MPPKKRKIPPHLMERVNAELVLQLENPIPFVTLVGGGSKDTGKTKKARGLEATEQFARYTDRIKELEVNDNIIYLLLCHQYLTFTLTQAQLASTQDSLTAALALNISQECDHRKKEMRYDQIQDSEEGEDFDEQKEKRVNDSKALNCHSSPADYWSPPRMTRICSQPYHLL